MRISIILLFVFSSIQVSLIGQNLDKYWIYRQRLTEQFLVVGEGQGKSVPAAYRNPVLDVIKWADATVDHGWYLGVLATEHYLLNQEAVYPEFQPGTYTLEDNTEELYYGLKALERLDLNAETAFILCPGLPSENGFFIRDDAPLGFHTHFEGMSSVLSDFLSINIYDKEMSQDQMYHLLMGLVLITEFVPPSAEFNGENLVNLAQDLAADIVSHVASYSNWTIKNPVCNKVVDRGPDAWSLSYGTNEAIKKITGNASNYDNDLVVILNEPVWDGLGNVTNPVHFNSDNTHMIMVLGAIGQIWNNNTLTKLKNLAALQDFYLYPLLHAAIYGTENVNGWEASAEFLRITTLDMLDEAPISGPASPQPLPGTHSWGSNNRFIRKFEDHINGGSPGQQYNGLDYMLLHNLYYMLYNCPHAQFLPMPSDTFCSIKTDIDLSPFGVPSGGSFSGPGVIGGNFFNPSVAGPGNHELVYLLEVGDSCQSSDTLSVFVDVCSGIHEAAISDLQIYPNPLSEYGILEYALMEGTKVRIELYDPMGKLIKVCLDTYQAKGSQWIRFDTDELSGGIYQLRIKTGRHGLLTRQIIKM